MDLVALVDDEEHVCCRYRLAAYRPYLEAAGHTLTIARLPNSAFGRLAVYRSLRSADVAILQRKLLSQIELAILRRYSRRLIFDFDDAIWLRDSYSEKGFESLRRAARFKATMRTVDSVFAGNQYLADAASRYATAERVRLVPTCIDPSVYPIRTAPPNDAVRLVWVGSSSTLQGLDRFRDVLEAVGREVPGTRLKLICDRFLSFEHLPVDAVPWSSATEARELADAEIGIGWVPSDPWSRGKCGLKILQYQAARLPVVANPVGVQFDLVREGVTGIPAETAQEWVHAIARLAFDPALRESLGNAGRKQVEDQFSVAIGARLWIDALAAVAHPARRATRTAG